MPSQLTRRALSAAILGCALFVSAGLNVALGVRVAQQRQTIESGQGKAVQRHLGRPFAPFEARDIDGDSVRIDFDRPTVLYFFQPGCGWCDRNYEAVLALYEQKAGTHRFLGVALAETGLSDLLSRKPLPFDVVSGLPPELLESYELGGTPRTIVTDSDGRIVANYFGAYFGATLKALEHQLDVRLPGVAPDGGT